MCVIGCVIGLSSGELMEAPLPHTGAVFEYSDPSATISVMHELISYHSVEPKQAPQITKLIILFRVHSICMIPR